MYVFYFNNLGNLYVKYKIFLWMLLIDYVRIEYNNIKVFRYFMLKLFMFIFNLDNVFFIIIILILRFIF